MKVKVCLALLSVLIFKVVCVNAQTSPFYTNSIEAGMKDEATDRLFIGDGIILPDVNNNFPLDKNIRNWAKDFLNSTTGFKLMQEDGKILRTIELFYKTEFIKKTAPKFEKMGIAIPLEYSNRSLVTYKAFYGHVLNDVVCQMDIATFDRNDGHRLKLKEIFKCDENTIKHLMYDNRPEFPCDLSSADDIKIISAGINRKSIDIVGTIYKGSTAIYQIPFEDAAEYLTDKAYKMHGIVITNKGTIFSDDAPFSHAVKYFLHSLKNYSVTICNYHNIYNDKDYSLQLDFKYDFDKDGKIKSKNPKPRLYVEIPSDDDNKEAFLEFSKSDAKDFMDDLQNHLKDYNKWKEKMASQNYTKYKLSNNGDGRSNISFYRKDDYSYGYDENKEYLCQYAYDKYSKTTAIVFKSGKKDGIVKKMLNLTPLASKPEKTINMEYREDKLSGWTLIIERPDKEIPEICKAIQSCIDKM